ncbi:MAG: hypothetical protein KAJ58_03010 [Candidatus Pacebacteria bacterium]|nr:hypothetical protein [Candidatus Paceibacterota bacterium]
MTTVFIATVCFVVSLMVSVGIFSYLFGCKVTEKTTAGVSTWRLNPKSVYRIIYKTSNLEGFGNTVVLILKEKYFDGIERNRSVVLEISLCALLHPLEKDPYSFELIPGRFSVETEFVEKEPILRLTHISRKQYREHGSQEY